MDFDNFIDDCKTYSAFAKKMKAQDNDTKGRMSEEYFLRYLKWAPWLLDVVAIYNTNDKAAKAVVQKYPELQNLGVGTANSPVVDIVVEHSDGYSLFSAKWYSHGLQFNEIAAIFGITEEHYPNLKHKYLITNAPRTSKVAEKVFARGKSVIKILEDDFDVSKNDFQQIVANKPRGKHKYEKWTWRTKREQESFIRLIRKSRKDCRTKFQGPPGWGKTYLMWRMDQYYWKRFGGLTISMADGVIVLKQNFELYNKQYKARGIERPSLVICSGADDEKMVDWPVEVVGNDPVRIARWIKNNPNGIIFCFYGNTKSLEDAVKAIKLKDKDFAFTFAACDEGSRTCSAIGSGWSHIVHDNLVPVKYRVFLDATHRSHKTYGMNVKSLYGEMGDAVSQAESEKWGSTTGYFVQGMIFESDRIQKLFHAREFVKGKTYTVEDFAMAVKLLEEFAEDATMEHNLTFGHTIKDLNRFASALRDARSQLLKKYKSKKYQKLADIEIYVADTHIETSRDIRDNLDIIYKSSPRSIVMTSRLLYRGWSQVKLDSILFMDNFKGISYIIQALGRGLRKNENRPDKICKVMIPVDLDNTGPWDHIIGLLSSLKDWDFRPIESIIGLNKKPRGKAGRRPQSGSVVLPMSGHSISVVDIKKSLRTVILNETDWEEWNVWHELAKDFMAKVESVNYLIPRTGGRNYACKKVYNDIVLNDRFKTLIDHEYKQNKVTKETKDRWLWRKIIKVGFKGIKHHPEYIVFKMDIIDAIENNDDQKRKSVKQLFDELVEIKKKHFYVSATAWQGYGVNEYKKDIKKLGSIAKKELGKYYPDRKDWAAWCRDLIGGNDLLCNDYRDKQVEEMENFIKAQLNDYVDSAIKYAIDLHKNRYVPMLQMRKNVIKEYPVLAGRRYEDWLHNGKYVGDKENHKQYLKYIDYPVLRPGQPRCKCCNKNGGEMMTKYINYRKPNQEKINYFTDTCITCKKQQPKMKKGSDEWKKHLSEINKKKSLTTAAE